jgi:hypothetical protein
LVAPHPFDNSTPAARPVRKAWSLPETVRLPKKGSPAGVTPAPAPTQ